ncbi:MAG: hypothetical protein ABIP51_00550 [Bacteroidia bacterium]
MIIKQDLYDNTSESFMAIEAKKQQIAFFPKEESQMFQSKKFDFVTLDAIDNSDNQDQEAFAQRATGSYLPLNSSFTATDYIGAVSITVPTTISDNFASFKVYDITKDTVSDLYDSTDVTLKIKTVLNGLQTLRIPQNVFNTLLDPNNADAILANGGSAIIKNFGMYYISIKPKYIESAISDVINKSHVAWSDIAANNDTTGNPIYKRREIIEIDKNDFLTTSWGFENNNLQSGRLYGSVVEIWDAAGTTLKQTKVMTENNFNFTTSDAMQVVLYPDNFGYDTAQQAASVGDLLRIYPRETFFDEITIEVNYKDIYLQVENMISFLLNDVARDITTGSYQVYDDKGLTVESTGIVTGTVKHKYQISSTDRYELRKRIKN